MKAKTKKRLASSMIAFGALLLAAGLIYEAIGFPWRVVLQKFGVSVSDSLPDPKPLSNYTFPDFDNPSAELQPNALPANNEGLPLQRPQIPLSVVGSIKLPAIGISENIVEGTGDELLYGVGHQESTVFPGQPGNCVLGGHRNYLYMHPFKYLPMMKEGDQVILSARGETYTYELYKIFEVNPDETWVTQLQDGEERMLTLITCTPIPSYSKRLICWGRLVESAE